MPLFIEEIKEMFVPAVLADYLENVNRVGVFGHVCDDETYEEIRTAGMVEDDAVEGAEDLLLLARMKELLLT